MQQPGVSKDQLENLTLSLAEQEAYWLKTLYGELPISDALLDHARSTTQLFLRDTVTLRAAALPSQLAEIAIQEKSDPLAILIAAFSFVLMRHADQAQFMIGTVASECLRISNGAIETFLNPLALLIEAADDPSTSEFLHIVATKLAEVAKNRDFPFDQLVASLQPSSGTARSPLFQVLVAFLHQQTLPGTHPLSLEDIKSIKEYSAQCDIVLLAWIDDDELVIQCSYDSTLFESTTIHFFLTHLRTALQHIGDGCQLSAIELMDDVERSRLLSDEFYPQTKFQFSNFNAYVEAWATQQPDEPAIIYADEILSYAELSSRVKKMAVRFLDAGTKRGDIVAVYLERGIDSVVAMLGTLKAGCIYLPLDKTLPVQRLTYILEDTQASVLITQQSLKDNLPSYHGQVLFIEQDADKMEATFLPPHDEDPVCILYTSGSTGRPKGVVLTQRMITNLIHWHISTYAGEKRILQFASMGFDQSLHEMGVAWASGGSLIIPPQAIKEDVSALADFLLAYQIEKAFLPVVLVQQLAEIYLQQGRIPDRLHEVIATGEQLVITQPLRDFFTLASKQVLINHYGPTETHVATSYHLSKHPSSWSVFPSIGRPIANVQTLVLTEDLGLTPIGVWGELYLAGDCLAQGYWQSPDLTAERFLPHPFALQPGQRMYRTGDRVRYHGDGLLEFGGRFDNQVKIRGHRVEPSEIEAVLAEHPEVRTAIVLTKKQDQDIWLIAYIVPEKPTLKEAELRQYLDLHLPAFMVPTILVLLDTLPLNTNGKVDRQKLPDPEVTGEAIYTDPRSEVEQKLVAIWQEILHIPQIGIQDNFFALGGHSLLGAQLISRLRQEFQVELTQFDIFEIPTVAGLAVLIESVLLLTTIDKQPGYLEEEIEF